MSQLILVGDGVGSMRRRSAARVRRGGVANWVRSSDGTSMVCICVDWRRYQSRWARWPSSVKLLLTMMLLYKAEGDVVVPIVKAMEIMKRGDWFNA